MKKTIYLKEDNLLKLRQTLLEKLQQHKESANLGKADKEGYKPFEESIRKDLKKYLEAPEYARLKGEESYVTYHSLWTIIYESKRRPEYRKRINRKTIELLILFAFAEIPGYMLEEEDKSISQIKSKSNLVSNLQDLSYQESLSLNNLKKLISKAQREVIISDTYFAYWRKLRRSLEEATNSGCEVKILLNDPNFEPSIERSYRISDLVNGRETLQKSIDKILLDVSKWERSELVKLETHDCFPGFTLFVIDDVYYIGFYWHETASTEGPFLKIEQPEFKANIDEHFDALWKYASGEKILLKNTHKETDERLLQYVGDWHLYCNKVEKNEESYKLRSMAHGKVVENLLRLKDEGGVLSATFWSADKRIFKGKALLCPRNDSFLEIQLKQDLNEDSLQFYIHIGHGLGDFLIGIYNHLYVDAPILGAGLSVMVKTKDLGKIDLESWSPRPVDEIKDEDRKKIFRYLTFPAGSRIESIQSFEHLKVYNRFNYPSLAKGVYKVYAYQGSESNPFKRYISESLLLIDEFYQAFHKRVGQTYADDNNHSYSIGKVESSKADSLLISLKSEEHGRIGFFVVNVGDDKARKGDYFTGIWSGVALRNRRVAIGNRVILQFMGTENEIFESTPIRRYLVYGSEFEKVPKEVRSNLLGRVNNMIGFLKSEGASSVKALKKEADNGVNLKQVFFDSACQRALTDDPNEIGNAVKMFERAILHGFTPFDAYEKNLEEYELNGLISTHIKDAILENKRYAELRKAITEV